MRVQKRNASSYCYLGFVLLCAVLSARVESNWEEPESLLAYLIDSGVINQEMAELLRDDCTLQLSQIKKTLQNLEEEISSTSDSFRNAWHIRANKQNPIIFSTPQVNKILIDCVSVKYRVKSPGTWYALYFRHIFGPRLSLARRVLAETPGQAPAPSPTASSHNPEPSRIPISTPENTARPPVPPFFPPNLSNESFPPTRDGTHPSGGASDMNSNGSNRRTVVIAVVVTACVTVLIAGFLLLFFRGCCGLGSRQGKNDERPLLSLSLSDYSISSSHKQYHSDASLNEEKLGSDRQSFKNNMNHSKTSGKFFNESHSLSHSKMEVAAGPTTRPTSNLAETTLPASPRIPGPPGLPPLMPPPGRTGPPKPPAPAPPPPPPIVKSSAGPPPPPTPISSGGPRPPPPPPGGSRPPPPPPLGGPHPPPLPPGGPRPPPPPLGGPQPPMPAGLRPPRSSNSERHSSSEDEAGTSSKAKLKPFFWDKVLANPDHSMVWHQIKSGSFQFNEEMIESLFGYAPAPATKNKNEAMKEASSQDVPPQYVQIIDAKKSQNLAILLKALNVTTEEVCDALEEGNELPSELIQNLLKMAPTADEELKLRVYTGELSLLGPAERFLKVLVNIPFAFKRLESLLYMCTLQEEISMLTESFSVLEAACSELRKSRLFLKLLEAVLKTGNRMNDGTFRGGAQAFKLDTLLKLSDVKGTDGKTTLLHFVVQEIIRSEGIRVARQTRKSPSFKPENTPDDSSQDSDEHLRSLGLEVVSGLGNELNNVRRAAAIDGEGLTGSISKLGHGFVKAREFLNSEMKNVPEENGFLRAMRSFLQNAEVDVRWAREEEKRIVALVKSTADYFHGNSGKDEGLRLFVIVRDFLLVLDKVCRDVKNVPMRVRRSREEDVAAAQVDGRQKAAAQVDGQQKAAAQVDARQRLFPAITDRRVDSSSSDDES